MGAEQFIEESDGKTAKEAFFKAVEQALYDYGHRGYTGTIAEKDSFVMIPLPTSDCRSPRAYAQKLIDEGDARIDDKWGPAGCIDLGNGKYLFFGWASA